MVEERDAKRRKQEAKDDNSPKDEPKKSGNDCSCCSDTEETKKEDTRMRVTLLSGFLGAGKTTLLKRILRLNNEREEKLRMAVVVNDMGEINLDAQEIKQSKVVQEDAQMVELHNGCICCTLRGDLLKTVKTLADEGTYDYLVIESTGIGEPLPVAQTFTMDIDEDGNLDESSSCRKKLAVAKNKKNSLSYFAVLDTLVTVVDALNIYEVLGSIETLADENNMSGMMGNTGAKDVDKEKFDKNKEELEGEDNEDNKSDDQSTEKIDEEDEEEHEVATRMDPTRLTVEQLRKELVGRQMDTQGNQAILVERLTQALEEEEEDNEPEIDDRPISQLWLDQIEFANVIVVSKASLFLKNASKEKLQEIERLLKRLNPQARVIIPMEDKYGDLDVSKELIHTKLFDMEKASASTWWTEELEKEEHNPETEEYGITSTSFLANHMPFHPERLNAIIAQGGFGTYGAANSISSAQGSGPPDGSGTTNSSEELSVFKGVVRSKGILWIANANAVPVNFQTAGKHTEIHMDETPFLAAIDRSEWDKQETEIYENMVKDKLWTRKFGDRRTQLVFIGCGLNKSLIQEKLTEALLTAEESVALGGLGGWKSLVDPFFGGDAHNYFEVEIS